MGSAKCTARTARLYSISYPNTWYTLQDSFDTHMYYGESERFVSDHHCGYYSSMEGLIKATSTALAKDVNDNIVLKYNSVTGKATVKLKNGYQLGFIGGLSVVFGFGGNDTKVLKMTESPYVADLAAMSTIYIYCKILQ